MTQRYPTEDELGRIRNWNDQDLSGLMEFVKSLWDDTGGWVQDGNAYLLITSGWSGNEDIIGAMQQNKMFWLFYWESSTRGGRHIFCPVTLEGFEKAEALRCSRHIAKT